MPQALLVIAGREGDASDAVHRASARSPYPDRVRLLGHRTDVAELLSGADLFAFPSLYEGLGGALLEAMALSCPIVGSNAPAIAEVLGSGAYGRVVERSDVGALSAALLALLGAEEERGRLARAARQRFEERYELERVVDQTLAMYETLLDSRALDEPTA
jgi:glycosyltransferase involved in cell wall biosynthesis